MGSRVFPQLSNDVRGRFPCTLKLGRREGYGSNTGVTATTVALADLARGCPCLSASVHGFDPTETLVRKLLLLRPTLYMHSGCR